MMLTCSYRRQIDAAICRFGEFDPHGAGIFRKDQAVEGIDGVDDGIDTEFCKTPFMPHERLRKAIGGRIGKRRYAIAEAPRRIV